MTHYLTAAFDISCGNGRITYSRKSNAGQLGVNKVETLERREALFERLKGKLPVSRANFPS